MRTIVFVHGTGVRDGAYTVSFAQVQQQLTLRLGATQLRVEPCFWGGSLGSDLFLGGISIPEFDSTRAAGDAELDEDGYVLALWALLYENPFAELALLGLRVPGEAAPGQEPIGAELDDRVRDLSASGDSLPAASAAEFSAAVAAAGLAGVLDQARAEVRNHPSYRQAIATAVEPLTDYRLAIARAIVAQSVALGRDSSSEEGAPFDGSVRDRIVELMVAAFGGREAGVSDWVKAHARRVISSAGTRWFRGRRGRMSAAFAPFGADIIVYQARPQPVRAFIRDQIGRVSDAAKVRGEDGAVTVVAHSLGGIAAVDMLIEAPLPAVRHLITVGSQAPLLYEMNALTSLPLRRDAQGAVLPAPHALPDGFPSWLNIFDPRDFLSYRAAPVFRGAHVRDEKVDNGQPFPASHSAYWTNPAVWDVVVAHLAATV